ncbi:CRISPR-associated protein [Oscillatoria acuminata]|uniref:CRISPR-associated protein (Cas_Cas02710) n=1 Tax=Oscillatoria acuminata PCC 6304 TaxID=56110 RepID=K9TPE5_9CYAN|nr:CRISPR-associated protein [Oscillatoria acuminata]AFY84036.1 CRISPR-associated protein (Cas_Cas02710) [Oscillatoria acuminata PCC 6304]
MGFGVLEKGARVTMRVAIQGKDAIARMVTSAWKGTQAIARRCGSAIGGFWSSLQLGRIFRRVGLPIWVLVGLAIASLIVDNLLKLLELAIRYFLATTPIPTPKDYLVHFIMIVVGLGLIVVMSLGFKLRRPLTQGRFISDGLTQPDGKKGLILLVSNPNSAMFSIEYHYETKRTLATVWLIPSDESQLIKFGGSSQDKAQEIQQRCEQLSMNLQKSDASNNRPTLPPLQVTLLKGVSPADAQETFSTVNKIYRQSHYSADEIAADFTGGTKPMSVGMIMACLKRDRVLEYVSYNKGQSFGPYIIDYQHSAFDLIS